ncbi:hypothetical protein MPTK1_4g21200 [Marchantia polymorpha subsp. ruderalis]|nr:hypothetical protein MARPO_0101s0066 [Marchantia polymorpha]BBN09618.1 hypothetical protein Mp_4g21200 [Marchantia polymorpha subsp. ruderalis]|eukprot:PTQ32279.1 hypothetical protein MARPO_0101s0066 [Marchantia polymorpha]
MKPQLVLMRILRRPTSPTIRSSCPTSPRSAGVAAAAEGGGVATPDPVHHTGTAQWDVNHPFHLAVLESQGILQTYMLETSDGGAKAFLYPCVAFQLHLSFGVNAQESGNKCGDTSRRDWDEEFSNGLKAIKQPWGSFEFIPKRPGEIIFVQAESSRILFAQLPGGSPRGLIYSEGAATQIDQDRTKVYCVGRHSSTILSIAVRSDGLALASAARDGCLRVWRLSDGTMIAQTMFARWRQPRNPGIGRVSPLRRQNDEIDCAYPALRVVSFFGKSWDVAMGCPSGEARTWALEPDEGSPLTIKRIADSATLISGKSPISSIALHVPDINFPLQQQQDEGEGPESLSPRQAVTLHERVAVGTANGKLQVWTRHKVLGDWAPTWSTTVSTEGASIVCLSFRADGGLLAAAASFLAKQLTEEETEALLLASPPKKLKRVCERLYLYETFSWACVGSFNFSSQIGSCLFYRPPFKAEDRKDPTSCVSREKLSSCRVLLVSTASGPQTHILPEHGLFGYKDDHVRYRRQQSFSRKESKTVRWADLKRDRAGAHKSCPSEQSPTFGSSTSSERDQLRPVTARDLLWTPNSPMGRSEARRNAAALKLRCRPPPIRSRSHSPANAAASAAGGCMHSGGGGVRRQPVRDPFRDPSLLSLPAECVGLPMEVVMRYRAGLRQWPPQVKSRKCVCCSKHARSKELPIPYPMGQVVIQKLKNVAAKQTPPARPAATRKKPTTPQARRLAVDKSTALASLATPSPTSSRPLTPQSNRRKTFLRVSPRAVYSRRFDHRPRREHAVVSKCGTELYDEDEDDCASLVQQQVQAHPCETTTPEEPSIGEKEEVDDDEEEEEEEAEQQQQQLEEEEELREAAAERGLGNLTGSCGASHRTVQQQKHRPLVIGGKHYYTTAKFQHFKAGKENFHDVEQLSIDAPGQQQQQQQQQSNAATQYSTTGKDSPVQSQPQQVFTDRNCPQLVGGANLPDKQIIGGNELEDFLVRSRSPLAVVGPAVREMAKERKLVQPEPFSTTKLMARLHEIEQETFSVDAALEVAKRRGIELNKEDEMELRKALEEENQHDTVAPKVPEPEAPAARPTSVRYTQLKKINDPRVEHPGPFLAPRKVRKQVDPKWEDMRIIKPTLSDLFDMKERCAQVCSPAPADIDHSVMYAGTERDVEDSEIWAQREATCRHAWSSQALYDSYLYRPDQRDPQCACNARVHVRR